MSVYDMLKQQAGELIAKAMEHSSDAAAAATPEGHAMLTEVIQMIQSHGLEILLRSSRAWAWATSWTRGSARVRTFPSRPARSPPRSEGNRSRRWPRRWACR